MIAVMDISSRIYGMWLGKSIGGTLGLPAEGRMERLSFTYYDPVPEKAPPNDDLELQIVWLELLERHGSGINADVLGRAWLDHIHYAWDEYGRCRWNLRRGVPAAMAGVVGNWFTAGMGSPIRSEIWACAAAGDVERAEAWARLDSLLDHGIEGAEGEVFLAVLETLALSGCPLPEAIAAAHRRVNPESETARALGLVCDEHARGTEVWAVWALLMAAHGSENFTHAPLNIALVAWSLLYGDGDAERTILLAVNGGYDTDCTAASAGAVMGAVGGPDVFSSRWTDPIGDGIWLGPGIVGLDGPPRTIGELTDRARRLFERRLPAPALPPVRGLGSGARLPATVLLRPLDGSPVVPWANGEMPASVLAAGGAEWDWIPGCSVARPRQLICLARSGARLLVDGAVAVDCPPGLPFVPAVHRCPAQSRTTITLPVDRPVRMRLELAAKQARQEVSVLLAGMNLDLVAWTGERLPHPMVDER